MAITKKISALVMAAAMAATMATGMAVTANAADTTEGTAIYESGVPVYNVDGTRATAQYRTINNELVYIDANGDYTTTNTGTPYIGDAIGAFWSQYGGTPNSAYDTYGWHPAPHGMDADLISGDVTLNSNGTVSFALSDDYTLYGAEGYVSSITINGEEYTVDDNKDKIPDRVENLPVDTDFALNVTVSMSGTPHDSEMTARFIIS